MKKLLCILLVPLLFFGSAKPVSANSAQRYWESVDRAGVVITDGDFPIVVEHELLTFDLQEFPQPYYYDETEFLAYTGKVTAQYTFYNPSALSVTAKLLFPFGSEPWYGVSSDADAQKYDILINGVPVEKKIRHTCSYGQFNLEEDLPLVLDGFAEDPFYNPDLTVTAYKFTVSGLDSQTYKAAVVGLDIPKGMGNQRFYLPGQRGAHRQNNDSLRIIASIKNGDGFYLYVFGEPLATMPTFKFYQDGGAEDREQIAGTATLTHTETLTFQEFAFENRSEESGVSEIDWYNATVTDINWSTDAQCPVICRPSHSSNFSDGFMRWYEYEITVAPGQKIVNTVTAPIYPSIDTTYHPTVYGYSYLLSPASTWKSFDNLDVVINTPFYMTHCTLNGFQKTDTGYKASFDGLPNGELYFEMSTSENPEQPKSGFNWGWLILLAAPFILIAEAFEAIGEFFTNLFQNLF